MADAGGPGLVDPERQLAAVNLVEVLRGLGDRPMGRRIKPGPGTIDWSALVSRAARPGTGGRHRRVHRTFQLEATRELREELGEPEVARVKAARFEVWQLDATGDGMIVGRLSGADLQQGETAFGQVHACRELCRRLDLRPKYLAVGTLVDVTISYEERPDFRFIRDRVASEGIGWVMYREIERVGRETGLLHRFFTYVRDAGVRLYTTDLGRAVNWDNDADYLYVNTRGVFSDYERRVGVKRRQDPLIHRWLEPGRGWPNKRKYGFRRDEQMFLEVDPEQWPFIEIIHNDYATLETNGQPSIRRLADHLASMGCDLSPSRVRDILRDEVYVTGRDVSVFKGKEYPIRPIKLDRPIPREVFEHNQALMASVRGRQRKHPLGYFLLNRIPFRHAACIESTNKRGGPLMLRATPQKDHYKHSYNADPLGPECRGLAVPRDRVERIVIQQLLGLCESPELREEWALRGYQAAAPAQIDGVLSKAQQETLEQKIENLKAQRAVLVRKWIDHAAGGTGINPIEESTKVIDAEITAYRNQITASKRLQAQTKKDPTPAADASEDALLRRAREVLTPEPPDNPQLAQLRLNFVRAALSEVILHTDGEHAELELRGPLIPRDSPFLPINPAQAALSAESTDSNTTDSHGNAYRSVVAYSARESWLVPAWLSPRFPLSCDPRGRRRRSKVSGVRSEGRWLEVLSALRIASRLLPPGRVPLAALVEALRNQGSPSGYAVKTSLATRGLSVQDGFRAALGDEAAVRLGRIFPCDYTREDMLRVFAWAIEDGMTFGTGWKHRWNALATERAWMPHAQVAIHWERRTGMPLSVIVVDAARRRGAAIDTSIPLWGPRRAVSLELCLAVLRVCSERLPPGRLSDRDIIDVLRRESNLPTFVQHQRYLHARGIDRPSALRLALGPERALRLGRVKPNCKAEWLLVIEWALRDGVPGGRGRATAWTSLSYTRAYLPSYESLKTYRKGADLDKCFAAAEARINRVAASAVSN
jgi:DNA invertase Pin-like site-specific DNA recombinase